MMEPFAMVCPQTGATQYGLTKHEYFAALAMQGILANDNIFDITITTEKIEKISVEQADALIAELNKESNNGN